MAVVFLLQRFLGAHDAHIGREGSLGFQLGDLGGHLIERRLDRIEARLCEVGEIALGGGALDVEIRDGGAARFQIGAGRVDGRFVLVGAGPEQ